MDVHLHQRKNPATRLMKLMRPMQERYASLILDCAPGMSLVSENVIHGADALVVPLLPSPLSVRTLEQLLEFVAHKGWSDLKVLPFFSMVDGALCTARRSRRVTRPFSADPRDGGALRQRLRAACAATRARRVYAPASDAAHAHRALWREITGGYSRRSPKPPCRSRLRPRRRKPVPHRARAALLVSGLSRPSGMVEAPRLRSKSRPSEVERDPLSSGLFS
jgi:cellulose biosynthesis protein BcsQ